MQEHLKSTDGSLQSVLWIAKDLHPVRIVEDLRFRDLMAEDPPRYLKVSRTTVINKLRRLNSIVNREVSAILNDTKCVAGTSDDWIDKMGLAFALFTLHIINDWKYTSYLIA